MEERPPSPPDPYGTTPPTPEPPWESHPDDSSGSGGGASEPGGPGGFGGPGEPGGPSGSGPGGPEEPSDPGISGAGVIPWEQPGLDFFSAFYETLRLLFRSPRRAFERVPVTPAIARPLGFAILIGWPGILAATLWDLAFSRTLASFLPWASEEQWNRSPGLEIAFALAAPLWLPVVLFIAAALQHLFLMMIGAGKRGFIGTFRVLCYAQVASLLGLIPLCGGLLSVLWHLVLQVIGLSAVHRIGTGRALLAVILPLLLCCACVGLIVAAAAGWMEWYKVNG